MRWMRIALAALACLALLFVPGTGAAADGSSDEAALKPGEMNDDDTVIMLDLSDYTVLQTKGELGLQENGTAPGSYFDDVVFVGDSITLKLYYYVKEKRNQGLPCLGNARFLASASLGSRNALKAVSKESVHPFYQGRKMRVEKAIGMMDVKKVYIMLGMNDVAITGVDWSISNLCKLIGLILESKPDVEIFVESVTPRLAKMRNEPTNSMLFEYNLKLYQTCLENGWYFVDVAYVMRDANGALIEKYCSDPSTMGLHFNDAGCAAWVEYLETHAKER